MGGGWREDGEGVKGRGGGRRKEDSFGDEVAESGRSGAGK